MVALLFDKAPKMCKDCPVCVIIKLGDEESVFCAVLKQTVPYYQFDLHERCPMNEILEVRNGSN